MAKLLAVNYNVDCLPEGKLRYAGICDFDAKDSMIHDQSFKKILSKIGKSLPSTSLQSLEMTYNKHKAGKTRRDAVIKHLNSSMFMTKKICWSIIWRHPRDPENEWELEVLLSNQALGASSALYPISIFSCTVHPR